MAKIKRDPRLMALAKQFLEIYELLLTDDVYYCLKEMLGGTIESMFEAEMDDHLGFPKGISADQPGNTRNGFSKQNAKSNGEPIEVNIPRDRKSEFDPKIIGKYKTDISDIEEKISPCMPKEWQTRPLEAVYPVVFLDAIHYHVRQDGAIVKKAVYNIMAYTMDGTKDILAMWIGENESSKFWLTVLNELKSRGVQDILITCIDRLTGFKEAINAVFPKTSEDSALHYSPDPFLDWVCILQGHQSCYGRSQACLQGFYGEGGVSQPG